MTDQEQTLTYPPGGSSWRQLHDAELVRVHIDRFNKKLLLGFRLFDHDEIRDLLFDGVELFRATDLIKQNVVSRIIMAPSAGLSEEEVANWVRWAASLIDTESLITDDALTRYVSQIEKNELVLFVLEPSWGSELVIVCRRIEEATGVNTTP